MNARWAANNQSWRGAQERTDGGLSQDHGRDTQPRCAGMKRGEGRFFADAKPLFYASLESQMVGVAPASYGILTA